jgi:hypothetical protein
MIFDDNVSCIRGRDPIPADVESSGVVKRVVRVLSAAWALQAAL